MKFQRIIRGLIALAVVTSVSIATVWVVSTLGKADAEQKSTTIDLREYEIGIDTTTISDDTIDRVFQHAKAVMDQYDTIVLENNRYVDFFCCDIEAIVVDNDANTLTIDTNKLQCEEVNEEGGMNWIRDYSGMAEYAIGLYFLTREYEDCLIEREFGPLWELNRMNLQHVLLCPGYQEAGYETVEDYYDAWSNEENREENEKFGNVYKVYVCIPSIFNDRNDAPVVQLDYCEYLNSEQVN